MLFSGVDVAKYNCEEVLLKTLTIKYPESVLATLNLSPETFEQEAREQHHTRRPKTATCRRATVYKQRGQDNQ